MLYITVWFTIVLFSILLFRNAAGTLSLSKLNLHSFIFYYSLLVSSYIGSLLIVLNIDQSYIIKKLMFEESREIGFWLVSTAMVLLPLTMVVTSRLMGFRPEGEFQKYWTAPLEEIYTEKKSRLDFYRCFVILASVSLFAVVYTLWKTFPFPLYNAILGSGTDLAVGRITAKSQISGAGNYLKNIMGIGLTPLLSMVAYSYAVMTKEKKWWYWFVVLFVGAILIQLYDLQKAPVLFYFAMFLLLRMWIGKTKLNAFRISAIGLLGVFYLIGIYTVFGVGGSDLFSYNKGPIGRIILTQVAPMYTYVDRYDEVYPYLKEEGLPPTILKIYGEDPMRSAAKLMADLFPEKVEAGTAGVLNTLYIGELYASFGWFGVILGTIYLGVVIQLLYVLILRLPKHPIFLSLLIFFTVNIPRALVGGFSDLIFNVVWITLTIIILLPLFFISLRDFRKTKELVKK